MREPSLTEPQVQVRLSRDLRSDIEEFRRNEPDIPTRPEAIRRLLKQAVMARREQTASHPHNLAQAG